MKLLAIYSDPHEAYRTIVRKKALAATRLLCRAVVPQSIAQLRPNPPLAATRAVVHSMVLVRLNRGEDTAPFWNCIDAINFVGDSVPGAWPYMTDADRRRRLEWACEYIASVRSAARAMRSASPPCTSN